MYTKGFLFLFLFFCQICAAQNIFLKGNVIDSLTSLPIHFAEIKLLKNKLIDTTDKDGAFTFGSLATQMLKKAISGTSKAKIHENGLIYVSIPEKKNISVQIFSIDGKKVNAIQGTWGAGDYIFPSQIKTRGIYCCRIQIGQNISTYKFLFKGSTNSKRFLTKSENDFLSVQGNNQFVGEIAPLDTLQVSKLGYITKKILTPVSSQNLTILMTPVSLKNGVKPGVWRGYTDQGQHFSFTVDPSGKIIDSFTLDAVLTCKNIGSSTTTITEKGPFTIPNNGVVIIRDTLLVVFSDSSAYGSIFTKNEYSVKVGECTHEIRTFYNGTWILQGYEIDTDPKVHFTKPIYFSTNFLGLDVTSLHGKVTKIPDKPYYLPGDDVLLIVSANTGFSFSGWTGDTVTNNSDTTRIRMNRSKSLIAKFSGQYPLSVISTHGSVEKIPSRNLYSPLDTVKLIAKPEQGYRFTSWKGNMLKIAKDTAWVQMNSPKEIVAEFTEDITLTVTALNGTVTTTPTKQWYLTSDTVRLIATPSLGYWFTNWDGEAFKTNKDTAWVTMTKSRAITAHFEKRISLEVISLHGSVELLPNKANYTANDTVKLITHPASGYALIDWSGDILNKSVDTAWVVMANSKKITALYYELHPKLTLSAVNGSVTTNPYKETYDYLDTVKLIATPLSGYYFLNWGGKTFKTSKDTAWVVLDSSKTISANFGMIITLTLKATNGILATTPSKPYYVQGLNDTVKITATPKTGYKFLRWTGKTIKTNKDSAWVLMDSSRVIEAIFASDNMKQVFMHNLSWPWSVAFSPNSQFIALPILNGIKIWDKNNNSVSNIIENSSELHSVDDILYFPDGTKMLISAFSKSGSWSIQNNALITSYSISPTPRGSAAISHDGTKVLIGSYKTAVLFDANSGNAIKTFPNQSYYVGAVGFSLYGSKIGTCAEDSAITIWDLNTGAFIKKVRTSADIKTFLFNSDATSAQVVLKNGNVRKINLENGAIDYNFSTKATIVENAAFSPDGSMTAITTWGSGAYVYETATGKLLKECIGHEAPVLSVAFSPDGSEILTSAMDSTAILWSIK